MLRGVRKGMGGSFMTMDLSSVQGDARTLVGQSDRETDGPGGGSFGALLRHLRESAGLTQEELAERAQLGERSVRALERDESFTPRLRTVRLLAQGLGLDAEGTGHLLAKARPNPDRAEQRSNTRHLPAVLTPLIGREDEVQVVKLMLDERRLLTLTGPGGVGKTRLALEVGRQVESSFDRVVMVDLAPAQRPEQVLGFIALQLGVTEQARRPLLDLVVSTLQSRRVLLILDNLEHLLGCRRDVRALVAQAAQISILVTSREPLHLSGERIYTVGPLALPGRDPDPMRSPAVRLFVERAADAGVPPSMDDAQSSVVAEICRRLDGLPLAIELAAAWTRLFAPDALLHRLGSGLMDVDSGPDDLPARQRTMTATIRWSYELLTEDQQTLFRRLSVFSGGFSLEAADTICRSLGPQKIDTLQGLDALRDKNLLVIRLAPAAGEPRFTTLETVRQFAHAQLVDRGEAEIVHTEHARYFLRVAEEGRELTGREQAQWLTQLGVEHDNLRAALDTCRRGPTADLLFRLVVAMWPLWFARNHFEEAEEWMNLLLGLPDSTNVPPPLRAQVFVNFANLVGLKGDNEVYVSRMRQALHLARHAGLDGCTAEALYSLGGIEGVNGRYEAAASLLEESLRLFCQLDDAAGLSRVLTIRAGLVRYQGEFDQAERLYQEALAFSRTAGDRKRETGILARLGNMRTERGMPGQSANFYEQALTLATELDDVFLIADVLERQGETATALGDFEKAMALYVESLDLYRGFGTQYGEAYVLLNQTEAALGLGDLYEARRLATESLHLFRSIDDTRCVAFAIMHLGDVAGREDDTMQALRLYRDALGRHSDLNTRPQIARCLERMACVAALQGNGERTAILSGAASALRSGMGSEMTPAERTWYLPAIERVRESYGTGHFVGQERLGRSLDLARAIRYALEDPVN